MNTSSYFEAVVYFRLLPVLVLFAVFGVAAWLDVRDDKKAGRK